MLPSSARLPYWPCAFTHTLMSAFSSHTSTEELWFWGHVRRNKSRFPARGVYDLNWARSCDCQRPRPAKSMACTRSIFLGESSILWPQSAPPWVYLAIALAYGFNITNYHRKLPSAFSGWSYPPRSSWFRTVKSSDDYIYMVHIQLQHTFGRRTASGLLAWPSENNSSWIPVSCLTMFI